MLINRISIYNEFQCLMGECPINCCRGWNIPIDDETAQKYNALQGFEGLKYVRALKKKDEVTIFESRFCRCPFWGRDGLCSIQKTRGEQYMPKVCIIFPRSLYNIGFFCEKSLYMACPGAARLFVKHARNKEHFYYESFEGTPDYEVNTTNDDKNFLDYLLNTREQIVNALDGKIRFDSFTLLKYALDAQNACAKGETLPCFNSYLEKSAGNYMIDNESFNGLLTNGFYHVKLLPRLPFLYKLCIKYKKEFSKSKHMSRDVADKKLYQMIENLYDKIPDLDIILSRFYEYYILKSFLNIFEDYSFAKNIFFGMIKTHMISVFLALFALDKETVSDDDIANVIAAFERRIQTLDSPYFNKLLSNVLQGL